jgi:penicillin-binding protein 1A
LIRRPRRWRPRRRRSNAAGKRDQHRNTVPILKKLFLLCFTLTAFGLGLAFGSWTRACTGTSCPSIALLRGYQPRQTAKVYAADGRLITELGAERRTVLTFDEISPAVRAAFIAIEDRRFYEHRGIDYLGIPRAILVNLAQGRFVEGFSTITMQLARNVFSERLPAHKDPRRKLREMKVALEIERTYDKNRILELYLNQLYLGGRSFGVDAAAQRFFGKSAEDVNVAEAATLAAVARNPMFYDPRRNPDHTLRRRNVVLNVMRNQGFLTPVEAEQWKAFPLEVSSRVDYGDVAPYFVEWIRRQLFDRYGMQLYEDGYRIYTTLDLDMQIAAEGAVKRQLERIENQEYGPYRHTTYQQYLDGDHDEVLEPGRSPYLQGALLTLDAENGYVRAMVGGRDERDSEFNRAVQASRQAGSTFKPLVYSAAVRADVPLSHIIDDAPISLLVNPRDSLPWEPQNFELDFLGPMTLRKGFYLSRNIVAIKLGMEIGIAAVIGEARRYGISTPLFPGHSLHIGAASVKMIEMVSAYTSFATLGVRAAPVAVLRVEDDDGNIIWRQQVRRERILDEQRAWLLTSLMQDVVSQGTAAGAVRRRGGFQHPAGGKTGTTNNGADVWYVGFTSELVTGVWLGFDQPRKIMTRSSGGRLAAPVWAEFMNQVYERQAPPANWSTPAGIVTRRVDHETGYLATGWCPDESTSFEWFMPGTEPTEFCPVHNPLRTGIPVPPDHDRDRENEDKQQLR